MRYCNSSWLTNDNSPLLKSFGLLKKKRRQFSMSIRYLYVTSVQEDKKCTFLILWNELQVSRNAILNIWTAWPLFYCRIFLITTRFSVILMTGRVKITKKIPDFSQSKTLFQFNKICSVMRMKFAPSLKHMNGVWRWQPITLCLKGLTLSIWNV